jgi:hypothetical protein
MPPQEERLTILEYDLKQYKTETIKACGEMAIEMIMVKGLMEDAVKRLASLRTQVEQRFILIEDRILLEIKKINLAFLIACRIYYR